MLGKKIKKEHFMDGKKTSTKHCRCIIFAKNSKSLYETKYITTSLL